MDEKKVIYGELSYRVVGAGFAVWKALGYGFLEKVYENALAVELAKCGISFEQQKPIEVLYRGHSVGTYKADLMIENKILVELKSAKAIEDAHVAQTLNYLKATGTRLGLILNFGPKKMEFKRIVL